MARRFNVATPRPKYGGGTWWHRVGKAHENDRGTITVYLDSVPVPDPEKDNKIVMTLFEEEEDGSPRRSSGSSGSSSRRQSAPEVEDDDEIPF